MYRNILWQSFRTIPCCSRDCVGNCLSQLFYLFHGYLIAYCDYCDWLFIYFRLLIIFIFLWFISIFTYLGIQFSPKVLYLLCKLYKSTSLFLYVLAKIVYVQILNSIDVSNSHKESKKCFIDSSFKIFCLLYLNLDLHVKYPYEKNTPHTTLPKYQYKFR